MNYGEKCLLKRSTLHPMYQHNVITTDESNAAEDFIKFVKPIIKKAIEDYDDELHNDKNKTLVMKAAGIENEETLYIIIEMIKATE